MTHQERLHLEWSRAAASPDIEGSVLAVVLRLGEQQHSTTEAGVLDLELGLMGDRWSRGARHRARQISLVSRRTLFTLTPDPGAWSRAGDNLVVDFDLSEANVPTGTAIEVGSALLRVSDMPHLGCARFGQRFGEEARAWVNDPRHRHLRLRGVYCEIVRGGVVAPGDAVRRREEKPI